MKKKRIFSKTQNSLKTLPNILQNLLPKIHSLTKKLKIFLDLEPVGSVAPRVNKKDGYNHDSIVQNQSLAIMCPAQAYPVPIYR